MKRCEVTATPRWARRKEDRPSELLSAALCVFGEKGFAGARLEDVAKMAGVSKGTVYLYYNNKEELLKAVVREHISPLVSEIQQELSSKQFASQSEFLESSIRLWWARYGSTQLSAITKIILGESHLFPDMSQFFFREVIQPWWAYLEGILKRGMELGEFNPIDTEYASRVLTSPLVILGVWTRTMDVSCQTETNPERYMDTCLQMFLQGLKNPAHENNKSTFSTLGSKLAGGLASDAFGLFKINRK